MGNSNLKRRQGIFSLVRLIRIIAYHPLNRNRKIASILSFIKWQIGSRLVPGKIIFPWVGGTKFIVSTGEHGLTQNIYWGLQEFSDMAYILHVLDKDDLFIDVGANVGSYTILACGAKQALGYCFEPVPSTFLRLMDNLRINDLSGRVKARNLGVADKNGHLLFTAGKNTANHIVTSLHADEEVIKVDVVALDEILAHENPAVIKIDVEGFETLVIEGALKTLAKPSVHSVLIELIGNGEAYDFDEKKLFDRMMSLGFKAYMYEPFARNLVHFAQFSPLEAGNIVFCKNADLVTQKLQSAPAFKIHGMEI